MSAAKSLSAFASSSLEQTPVGDADFEPRPDGDELDWDDCEGDPTADQAWNPFDVDEDEESLPEYGDFWPEFDDFDD